LDAYPDVAPCDVASWGWASAPRLTLASRTGAVQRFCCKDFRSMKLLIGGDSELGVATYRYLKKHNRHALATTRRRNMVSPERPYFDILDLPDDWKPLPGTDAACIFVSVARLRDCASDPAGSARINVEQMLRLIDRLTANGVYVLFLSTNQVFNGDKPTVAADFPACPVSEYGRQKAEAEAGILERIANGAPLGILRLSKVVSPNLELIQRWIDSLRNGRPVQAFNDMAIAPVPIDLTAAAVDTLLQKKLPGTYQLTGPRDVTYYDVALHIAKKLGISQDLIKPVGALSSGMPEGATPLHTTLDSSALRDRFGISVPDVWEVLAPLIKTAQEKSSQPQASRAKVISLNDLREVSEGVYYSRYPIPLVDSELIAFLKQIARTCPLRRARFCAHATPDAEQHDMLIVTHNDSYVAPHRHMSKSETFVLLEGECDMILFDEHGTVEKVVSMGPASSGRPFFYRMPPGQFHSLAANTELLVFLENTKGPFRLDDREYADWAPDYKDSKNGNNFIASALLQSSKSQ
jgi:dTDP-4-dehydrorhamnose reductase